MAEVPAKIEYTISRDGAAWIIGLESEDGTNRLTRALVNSLADEIEHFGSSGRNTAYPPLALIIDGNSKFFSAGADLNEISRLTGPEAYEFALMGQRLMNAVDRYPAPVIASIQGYCMGGGLDLALSCDYRICSPNALFGHRGAALGIVTGWGGTQRLPRLVGKSRAMQMFLAAEKIHAEKALEIGLVDAISPEPLRTAIEWVHGRLVDSPLYSQP
jgi:enoyl-CoA hydratase/carnithine racemase